MVFKEMQNLFYIYSLHSIFHSSKYGSMIHETQ